MQARKTGALPCLRRAQRGRQVGLERKQGVLVTGGRPEPSLAFELLESHGKRWLASGWSLDAITTTDRGALGIAKDLFAGKDLEPDLGAYLTQDYQGMFPACLSAATPVAGQAGAKQGLSACNAQAGAAGRQGRLDPALGVGLSVRF